MKKHLPVCIIFFLCACSNTGLSSNDVGECRELAYEKKSTHSNESINYIYNQCIARSKKAKDKQNNEDAAYSFLDFILDIVYSNNH